MDQNVGEREKGEEPLKLICAKGSTFDKENELLPCSSVFRQRTLPPFQFLAHYETAHFQPSLIFMTMAKSYGEARRDEYSTTAPLPL